MKKINMIGKRLITSILTFCILLGIAGTCMNVSAVEEMVAISTEEPAQELTPMMAGECCDDDYGYAEWSSLEDAMNTYGTGYTYTKLSTPIIRSGNIYTHYYTFSNGSRMYFGVIE